MGYNQCLAFVVNLPHVLRGAGVPSRCIGGKRTAPRCAHGEERRPWRRNAAALSSLGLYAGRLFVVPPFAHSNATALREALDLSLNFAYVTPLLFADRAPVLHPMLEGVFHIVVAWALLLLGFASLDATHPNARPRAAPFLVGTLLLTNLVYLPFLVARRSAPPVAPLDAAGRGRLVRLAESRAIPASAVALFAASVPWALYARPHFGDVGTRFLSFVDLTAHHDILAFSFALDLVVFALFQAALVSEDAACRQWTSPRIRRRASAAARFVPFFGLVFYLLQRHEHAPLQWPSE